MRKHPHYGQMKSSIGSLLRDPEPSSSTSSTPRGGGVLASLTQGQGERPIAKRLSQYDGCSVYSPSAAGERPRTSRSAAKNATSAPNTEMTHVKGRATIDPVHKGSSNPILNPESKDAPLPVRQYGRAHEHHGNIISAPPSDSHAYRSSKSKQAAVAQDQKARREHGDIITGAHQSLATGSGKRRSQMADAVSNRSTLGLLAWSDSPSSSSRPGTASNRNSSQIGSLLKDAAPRSSPAGQTLIDRLAVGTAYAVTAPRSVAAGSGLADLRK